MRDAIILTFVFFLAGCGGSEPAEPPVREFDPAVQAALREPLMIDPEMVLQNNAASAYVVAGEDIGEPFPFAGPDAAARAEAEAAALLGTDAMIAAPEPSKVAPLADTLRLRERIAADGLIDAACRSALRTGYAWAARVPDAIPIYPHGATQEAVGSATGQCDVRAVRFTSAVDPQSLANFYWSVAKRQRLDPQHLAAGEARIVAASGADLGFTATVESFGSGVSRVDLVIVMR